MAIRESKGIWIADVTFGRGWDGRVVRKRRRCKTRAEAEVAERELLIERDTQRGNYTRMTLAEFVEHVYWPLKDHLKPTTKDGYNRDLKLRILPAFGALNLDEIDRLGIQRMLDACPSGKTARNARATLSAVLTVAVEMGLLTVNPAGFSYRYPDDTKREPGSDGEVLTTFAQHVPVLLHAVKHHAGEPVERLLVLGLCFGLRKNEMLGLDWEHVDMDARTISVVQAYNRGHGAPQLDAPKTARSVRTIPMTNYAYKRMRAWGPGTGAVVTFQDQRMNPHTAQRHIRAMVENERYGNGASLPRLTLKALRHSFATSCINAGVEVSKVSAWLGHTDVSTTYNRYVRPGLDDLERDVSIINDAMGL